MAEDKAARIGYLIVEELAEVLLVHLALLCVNNCRKAVELHIVSVYVLNCSYDIAELSDAGGFYEDTVGSIVRKHLFKSLSEVAHQ